MSLKLVALFALVAVAYAAPGGLIGAAPAVYAAPAIAPAVYAAPAVATAVASNSRDIYRSQDVFGNYGAGYSVADGLTGDVKVSHEEGIAGAKVGSNSQLDPNGYIRTTDYVSDAFGTRQVITGSENGLYVNAKDHAIRPNGAVPVAAAAPAVATYAAHAPVVAAAPAIARAAVHTAYAAPAVHTAYAAPAIHAAAVHTAYAAPAIHAAAVPAIAPAVHTAYAAPALHAAAVHTAYAAPAIHAAAVHTAYAAPAIHGAAVHTAYAAPVLAKAGVVKTHIY